MVKDRVREIFTDLWSQSKMQNILPVDSLLALQQAHAKKIIEERDFRMILSVVGGELLTFKGTPHMCSCLSDSLEHLLCFCPMMLRARELYPDVSGSLPLVVTISNAKMVAKFCKEIYLESKMYTNEITF